MSKICGHWVRACFLAFGESKMYKIWGHWVRDGSLGSTGGIMFPGWVSVSSHEAMLVCLFLSTKHACVLIFSCVSRHTSKILQGGIEEV